MAEEKTFDIKIPKKDEKKAGLPPELEKKVKDAEKRLASKPDAPKEKKADVAIPMDAIPSEIEAEIRELTQTNAYGNKAFDVMVTNYLASKTNDYGISKDTSAIVNGLEEEMMTAYTKTFGLSEDHLKDMKAQLKLGAKIRGPGFAFVDNFRNVTGFDSEFKENLLQQKRIDYQAVKDTVLERASKSLFRNLRSGSGSKFQSVVTSDNWTVFKSVPLTMARKLGLEDQIDDSRIAHRGDVVGLYQQMLGDYVNRFRAKYLN